MSKRLNLREFQQGLSNRIQAKDRAGNQVSTLGVQIAGANWLVDMGDVSEVLPLPPLTRVPLSKSWFRGVTNVRGNLYCVADMAAYQHNGEASGDIANRVLLLAERHGFNAALLVDRVLGLRDARTWQQSEAEGQSEYRDNQGGTWHKLDIVGLLEQAEFLQVAI
ncbi:MAG: chemotaxis protein CheW [Gallionellaceae bacterium]|nr:MAG: chemotaxis protein CheW [Gallionellaceae bacterium]